MRAVTKGTQHESAPGAAMNCALADESERERAFSGKIKRAGMRNVKLRRASHNL